MRFLSKPHLPVSRAALCALAAGQTTYARALSRLGVRTLPVQAHPALPGALACHADLSLHPLGGARVLLAHGCEALAGMLRGYGFSVEICAQPLEARYPGDIRLCCFALGGKLYCKPSHTACELLARYEEVVCVRQGYAKCLTCLVDEYSAITCDAGIARALEQNGLAVLRIRPGHILLPGFAYGFIGGCAGLVDRNLLAFTGNLSLHPDAQAIRRFCHERGVETHSLDCGPLVDIGGILPLMEAGAPA